MTRAYALALGLMKETRALLPAWLACTLVIAAGAVSRDHTVLGLGVLAYGFGSILLGAQSIGHEYSHRTLGLLLAQPLERRRLLLTKAGVLAVMLAISSTLAWTVLFREYPISRTGRSPELYVFALVPLCALFLAPWLTMVCRSPLAAVVFTIVIPPTLLIVGDIVGAVKYGWGGAASIDRFKIAVFVWGTLVACGVAAISGWRMFMRLEVIEGRGPEIDFLQRDDTATQDRDIPAARVSHRLWLLAKKELRLQQMTFVMAALYFVGWGALTLVRHFGPELPVIPAGALTLLYFGLLSILIGSLASAEERQYGTLEWHLLLPMSAARQWGIKAGVALGLAVLLGIGLPALLSLIDTPANDLRSAPRLFRDVTLIVLTLTTCSLYLSSLSTSGVRAMALALPVALAAVLYIRFVVSILFQPIFRPAVRFLARAVRDGQIPLPRTETGLLLMMLPALLVPLLGFASINHRSAARNRSRIAGQVLWIAGFLALGVLLLTVATPR